MNAPSSPTDAGLHAALVAAVHAFASRSLHDLENDARGSLTAETLEELRQLGLFGLTLPTEYGGLGADLFLASRVVRTLAEFDRSVATTLGLHLGLGTRALVRYGSPQTQTEFLPRIASGDCIAAFATTEPQSGSDLSRLTTRLERDMHGALRLCGEKAYITNGSLAGLLTVTARTSGFEGVDKGLVMAVVPTGTRGVTRGPEEHKLGLRASSTTGFHFDDVDIQPHWLLNATTPGHEQLEHTLSWGRTMLSAGCIGTATAALKKARQHTALRVQFGRTLDQQPVVRGQLARCLGALHAMESMVAVTAQQPTDESLHRWSVSTKVFCSEQASHIVDTSVQLLGAGGYLERTGLPLLLRDLRVTRIFEGANDVLLTLAGTLEFKTPRAPMAVAPAAERVIELVRQHVTHLRKTLGVRVFLRPELLHRLGRCVVWRDAVIAMQQHGPSCAVQRIVIHEALSALRVALRDSLHPDDLAAILEDPT